MSDNNISNKRIKRYMSICLFCNKEFSCHKWSNQKYCSKECAYNKIKKKVICNCCTNEFFVSISRFKRSKEYFYCSKSCYNNRRKETLVKLKRTTKFYQNLLNNSKCSCGEDAYFLLQIHHIDGNNSNNDENNLEIVCSNCHIKRHLKQDAYGRYIYSTSSLTDRNLLNFI